PNTGSNRGVALADFDNNGTLDLVVANGGGQEDVVYTNDGAGNFSLSHTLDVLNANDVAVGDFDNDGDMDIAVATSSPNPVYFGNGNGTFGSSTLLGDDDSFGVAVGRFDNNDRDDLVFANVGSPSRSYTKDAGGTGFTLRDDIDIGDAVAVAAAELSGDGLDDVVFGRVPTNVGDIPSNPVMTNNGAGNFGTPDALLGISPTNDVLIGDVNEEGFRDIVFINASGVHQIWNASSGSYELHSEQIIDGGAMAGVLTSLGEADTGDLGGDDLAMGGATSAGVGVYLNDSGGNLGRGDAVPPEITLVGEASVSTPAGSAYVDQGATAVDNIDGDVVPLATSNVNTSVTGNYTVTYNVTDFAGNAATPAVRNVTVTPATGRGGGGGGASSWWLLALLVGGHLSILMRAHMSRRHSRTRTSETAKER
ncbi:MAG: FG-GAP-like repeat-containing protein, partial [Woeseiaceae bacterium]